VTSPIRAVVFDFDGLILDTEMAVFRGIAELWEAHGCTLDQEEWSIVIGTRGRLFDPYAALAERATVPVPTVAELEAAHDARIVELLAAEVALPGVVEWLEAAPGLGLRVAIASSASGEWVEGHLDRLGLRHHFEVVSTWDESLPPKPAPDLYLRACAGLGVEPGEAIAVEDSPPGVASATAAGLWCIAVPNAMTRSLDLSAAHWQVASLAELPLGQALELAARHLVGEDGGGTGHVE